jgi:RNA polymerase primary sigma factor
MVPGARQSAASAVADATTAYLATIAQIPRLTPQEELELGARSAQGDQTALRRLVEANLRLVVYVAKHYHGEGLTLLDLIQEGNIGLLHAARKFDARQGYRFSTYAICWIRQGVRRAIATQGQLIRVPEYVTERRARVSREEQGTERSGDREAARLAQPPLSLEQVVGDDQDVCLGDALEDPNAVSPVEAAEQAVLRARLQELLRPLPPRERSVLEWRFGLVDGCPRTLNEVSRRLGLSRERIRQLEHAALGRLRVSGQQVGLEQFLPT